MLTNTRNLHFVLDRSAVTGLAGLSIHQLKRKHPGEHVAFTTPQLEERLRALDLFQEIHVVDVEHLQRCSFSPVLGDEVALRYFLQQVAVLRSQRWSRIFNLSHNPVAAHLIAALQGAEVFGTFWREGELLCAQGPLKLLHLLRSWGLSCELMETLLTRKALNQFDAADLEASFRRGTQTKLSTPRGNLKGILAGIRTTGASDDDERSLEFLSHLFTACALDAETCEFLRSRGLPFEDWSQTKAQDTVYLDLLFTHAASPRDPWDRAIGYAGRDPEDLTDLISAAIPQNFRKWTSLAFLFDYLGVPKLAYACEQAIGRYDTSTLQGALQQEVLALKSTAKALLDGIRQQGSAASQSMEAFWSSARTSASFVAAIELSLRPGVKPLIARDNELLAVKNRLRTLNAFYERSYRSSTLEMPSNDLALML